jgi:NAD(P)-dependent dehydrogenase (short-subunit alcohol dehydrogenase family)
MNSTSTSDPRIAVVTGSASGMGLATARLLTERGYRVIGIDLRNADVTADLSTDEGRSKMVTEVQAMVGDRVDAVIANAGVTAPDHLCYAVNYYGAIATLEGFRPMLARSSAPRAVATASFAAANPADPQLVKILESGGTPEGPTSEYGMAYIVSKYAIAHWVRKKAPTADWAGAGIMLNAVCPGMIETPMQVEALKHESVQALLQAVPMARTAQATELAEVFAFLASEQNSYMTGQLLFVDGGLDAMMRADLV